MESKGNTPRPARANLHLRSLLHPLWLASLALLALNDHFLKGAGLLPDWLTGKMSDGAGMLVAPLLLAAILRVDTRRGWVVAHVAVGAVFASINVSQTAARALEALTALTPLPWHITVDATDAVALPLLLVSLHVFGRTPRRLEGATQPKHAAPRGWRPVFEMAALAAGMLACMGTAPPNCEDAACIGPSPLPPTEQAVLTIGNTTAQSRLVRVRHLAQTVVADCETLLADPTASLHRDMFTPADAWLLEPGRALPLTPRRSGCEAFLVDAQGLPMTLIVWDSEKFSRQMLPTAVDQADTLPGRMIMMLQEQSELALEPHEAVFDAPLEQPLAPEPACAVPDRTVGLAWSELPLGTQAVVSITSSPDGCHDVELEASSFYVCLPLPVLPFAIGERIDVDPFTVSSNADAAAARTSAEGIVITGESHVIRAAAGAAVLSPSVDENYDVSVATQPGCAPHHDACGNYVTPLEVTYLGSGLVSLEAGQSAQRSEDASTLYLVRAQRMPIRDTACTDIEIAESDLYFESVLVTPIVNEEL